MRIGIFTDTYFPQINGVSTSICTLKESLENAGHTVFIFTTTDSKEKKKDVASQIYRVPSVPVAKNRRLGVYFSRTLLRLIKTLELDLIHTHTEFSVGLLGCVCARRLKIPHVHTYHTMYEEYTHHIIRIKRLEGYAKVAARKLSARFCAIPDHIVAPSEKVRELLQSYGVEANIKVVPTGIDSNKFHYEPEMKNKIEDLKETLGIKVTDRVILYIGRIAKEKNVSELIHYLSDFLKEEKDYKLLFVGDGPDMSKLVDLRETYHLEDKIIFAGEVPWETIGVYYHLGDVFISASQSETQGLTYYEALAAGIPILVKSDPCTDHIVVEGVNGYTYLTQDDFLDKLRRIMMSPGHVILDDIEDDHEMDQYGVQTFFDQMEAIYENAIHVE